MIYYASKCHDVLNGKPFDIERDHPYLCLNPSYPASVSVPCEYILDSGAYQDVGKDSRLSFRQALDRQLAYQSKVGIPATAIVSYDRLVDEQKGDHGQFKARVDADTGADYVEETVKAAEYLSGNRDRLGTAVPVLSCQGTSVDQYMGCVENVLDVSEPGDILGIGGFCIASRKREYMEQLCEVVTRTVPMLEAHGIDRIHIFGMGVFGVLVQVDMYARMHGVTTSYDTSSAEVNSVMGRVFSPVDGRLKQVYTRAQKYTGYHPTDLAKMNIRMIGNFWDEIAGLTLPSRGGGFRPEVP